MEVGPVLGAARGGKGTCLDRHPPVMGGQGRTMRFKYAEDMLSSQRTWPLRRPLVLESWSSTLQDNLQARDGGGERPVREGL